MLQSGNATKTQLSRETPSVQRMRRVVNETTEFYSEVVLMVNDVNDGLSLRKTLHIQPQLIRFELKKQKEVFCDISDEQFTQQVCCSPSDKFG